MIDLTSIAWEVFKGYSDEEEDIRHLSLDLMLRMLQMKPSIATRIKSLLISGIENEDSANAKQVTLDMLAESVMLCPIKVEGSGTSDNFCL